MALRAGAGGAAHVHAAHALPEFGEDLVGSAGDTVDPVVQDDHPFVVVRQRLARVLDDQRGVQAAVELDADVRVEDVRARGVGDEPVGEGGAGAYGGLGGRGTPSMSLRRAMPCQWIEVVVLPGSWFASSATRVSPAESRISLASVEWPPWTEPREAGGRRRSTGPGSGIRSRAKAATERGVQRMGEDP